jgi:hypothetical protein
VNVPKLELSSKVWQLSLVAVLILAAGAIGFWLANYSRDASQPNDSVQAPAYRAIKYPDYWIEDRQISAEENQQSIISRASRTSPAATAFVRAHEVVVPQDFDINKTADDIARSLEQQLRDATIISKKVTKAGEMEAIQVEYKQSGEQYLLVVIPDGSTAYYLTVKSKLTDFNEIANDAQSIAGSLASYIANK